MGDSISLRTVQFEDTCAYGSRVVEDVQIENEVYRRLLFLDQSANEIQAEVKLTKGEGHLTNSTSISRDEIDGVNPALDVFLRELT